MTEQHKDWSTWAAYRLIELREERDAANKALKNIEKQNERLLDRINELESSVLYLTNELAKRL